MKKFIYVALLIGIIYVLFAGAKKGIENSAKKDVSPKEFQQADKLITTLQEQGKELSEQGKYDEAMQCYQKALAQADKIYGKDSTASAMLYTSIATLYVRKKDGIKAAEYLVKASSSYKNSMGGMLIAKNYYTLRLQAAKIYCDLEKTDTAYPILKGLENEIKMVPPERKAELYYLLASCIYDQKKYIQAIKYCKMADENASSDDKKIFLLAQIYDVWACSLVDSGKRKEALAIRKKCIEFAKKDGRYASFIGQAMFYTGTNYVELDDYSEAKKYLMEALVIFRQLDKSGVAWEGSAYLFLAHNARYHNKWKEAEAYYEKATVLFERILFNKNEKNEFSRKSMDMAFIGTCKAYKWLQQCFYINKNQKKAIEVYRKVKALKKAENSLSLIADIYPGIISNYMDLKKYEEALFILDEGLGLYGKMQKSSEDQDQFATLWWLKANIFHLSGQCEMAVQAGEKAYAEFAKNHDDNSRFLIKISSCIKGWKSLETKK